MPEKKKQFKADRAAREKSRKLMERILRFYHVTAGKRDINDFYYEYPVEDKTVLLSGLGRNVNGSLRYILNELNYNDDFDGYRIYVRTTYENTDEQVKKEIEKNNWKRTETVPRGFNRKLETCKYLLTESWFPYQFIKRPDQVVVDIWHGTPLKSLGLLRSGSKCHLSKMEQKNFLSSDYLTYPNDYTKNILWDSYKVAPLLTARSVMMGYPRTAGMLSVSEDRKDEIRSMLELQGKKIYAYMPTFREYLTDEETVQREQGFLDYMDVQLNDEEVLFVNLHHFHHRGKGLTYDRYKHIRTFPDDVDTYELLSVTDALISDYSSVFLDYLILKRKVILYTEDIERYDQNQGLNMRVDELPVDVARSEEEVVHYLRDDDLKDTEEIKDLYQYDNKNNIADLCRIFLGDESKLTIVPNERENGNKKILIYDESFASQKENAILFSAVDHAQEQNTDIYVCCDEEGTDRNIDKVYPELHNINIIGSDRKQPLSCVGKEIKKLYDTGKIPFFAANSYLKYDYKVMGTRMFGNAHFDTMCIYDTLDAEMIMGLSLSDNADTKVLAVSSEMLDALRKHDRQLKDALRFAAAYCDLVVTSDPSDVLYLRRTLNKNVLSYGDDIIKVLSLA